MRILFHPLLLVGLGLTAVGLALTQYRALESSVLPTTIHEVEILVSRRQTALDAGKDTAELHRATIALVECLAGFVDGPLRGTREEVLDELELERGLITGQGRLDASESATERFLRLGGLGVLLGQVNALETHYRRLCASVGRLSFDFSGAGDAPIAVETYREVSSLAGSAAAFRGAIEDAWGTDAAWAEATVGIDESIIELRAIWERTSGSRFDHGVPQDVSVERVSGDHMPNSQLNELGERIFASERGVSTALQEKEAAGQR